MFPDEGFHRIELGFEDVEPLLPLHEVSKPRRKRRVNTACRFYCRGEFRGMSGGERHHGRARLLVLGGHEDADGRMVRADERLREEFPLITLPVLIMHGTDDRATVCHGSQFFHQTVGSVDKTLKLYEGHYHDLLNDVGKEQVMADITAWMVQRLR